MWRLRFPANQPIRESYNLILRETSCRNHTSNAVFTCKLNTASQIPRSKNHPRDNTLLTWTPVCTQGKLWQVKRCHSCGAAVWLLQARLPVSNTRDYIPFLRFWKYCHLYEWLSTGFGIGDWIYWHFNTRLVTTRNYSAIPDFHNFQITTAPAKHFPACCVFISRSLTTDFNKGTITVSLNYVLQISHIKASLHSRTFNWALVQLISCRVEPNLMLRPTVSRPVCLGIKHRCGFVDVERSLWREDGSVVYSCCWSSPARSFSGPSPTLLSQIRDFPFRRLLRLAGLRWRYSTPPPHGILLTSCPKPVITSYHGPRKKYRFQQFLYCCMWIGSAGTYLFRGRYIATVLHAIIDKKPHLHLRAQVLIRPCV
jgi:hypothetical protein